MQREEETKMNARRDAFARIAFWQYMAFIFLLCFVCVIEVLDIPHRAFGAEETPFSLYRVCLLSAAVIGAAVIAIGHTYEQQRSLLRKLLKTCLYCHRVKTPHGHWEHVEEYFIKHYPISMERGACPACEEMLTVMNKSNDNITDVIARKGIESRRAEPACATKAS
jgi:hypothetical protein